MDCCSLEGRTLKEPSVVKHLHRFVLVRLHPVKREEDRRFAAEFGREVFPGLLFLDWRAREKLGEIGDVPAEELATKLREVREAAGL